MSIDQDHFTLFGLPRRFAVDRSRLDEAYRAVQAEVHPDRFAAADAARQRVSLQWATRVNEAYQVLRDPVRRACYLCELMGIDLATETNTAMSPRFLVEQMEWREALDDARAARDAGKLETLADDLRERRRTDLSSLERLFDELGARGGDAVAHTDRITDAVRELMFIEKFGEDIALAHEAFDS
jgi:molecular chaperone HscB